MVAANEEEGSQAEQSAGGTERSPAPLARKRETKAKSAAREKWPGRRDQEASWPNRALRSRGSAFRESHHVRHVVQDEGGLDELCRA